MHRWWIAAGGLISLALLGGAQGSDPSTNPTFTVDPLNQVVPDTPEQAVPAPEPIIDPMLQPVIDYVLQDMTAQFGVDSADVEVLEARAVVWPDGGLGCPMPDMAYIQVQVEGSLIRTRVGDRIYEYHAGGRRAPFLCDNPAPAPAPRAPGEVPQPPPGGSAAV